MSRLSRTHRWLIALAVVFVGLPLLAGLALLVFLPSDEALARRAEVELEKALGVKVTIGALHWQLLPAPQLVVTDFATAQDAPITGKRLLLRADTSALWQRRLALESAELDGAVIPQLSLRELGKAGDADKPPAELPAGFQIGPVPVQRVVFRDITWVSRRGIPVVYEGNAVFEPGWRPRTAEVRRPGFTPETRLDLSRIGNEDRWTAKVKVGGGTGDGEVQIREQDGKTRLTGQLKPRGIEVQSALAAFNRKSIVTGRVNGDTTLQATGTSVGELTQSLHTTTVFSMKPATLLRFDLDKAIRTLGKDHAGQTPLDSLTGQLDTQNGRDGMTASYTDLKASSGALSASGKATLANRRINAEFAVDLVDGIVGVPLKITGPVTDIAVSVPAGAVAGAVVGTAVLPGIGTAIGARIGATIGKLFGGEDKALPPNKGPAPVKKTR